MLQVSRKKHNTFVCTRSFFYSIEIYFDDVAIESAEEASDSDPSVRKTFLCQVTWQKQCHWWTKPNTVTTIKGRVDRCGPVVLVLMRARKRKAGKKDSYHRYCHCRHSLTHLEAPLPRRAVPRQPSPDWDTTRWSRSFLIRPSCGSIHVY